MNKTDNLNKYLILALMMHALFLVSFSSSRSVNDITTIGETGMAIQMMILETSDEEYEKSFASEEIRNKTEDSEKEQQVILDNRAVGEKSENTYDTYNGIVRQIIDKNKLVNRFRIPPLTSKHCKYTLLFENCFTHTSIVIRKFVFDEIGAYSTSKNRQPPEDYELWSRISRCFEIANLPDKLV